MEGKPDQDFCSHTWELVMDGKWVCKECGKELHQVSDPSPRWDK